MESVFAKPRKINALMVEKIELLAECETCTAGGIVGLSQFCCNKQEDANGFCEAFSLCTETQSH